MSWYAYSLLSLVGYGLQNFLYKVAAERQCNSTWLTMSFMGTVMVLGWMIVVVIGSAPANYSNLILLSVINALSFLITVIARVEALKHLPASVAYPIIRMSLLLVVIYAVVALGERLNTLQIIGFALALVVIVLLARQKNQGDVTPEHFRKGLLLALLALVFSAVASIVGKTAATAVVIPWYIALSATINFVLLYTFRLRFQSSTGNSLNNSTIRLGISLGILNLGSYYAILTALAVGPLALVGAINSMSFVIAIVLSVLVYKEQLSLRRTAAIILAAAAVIMLRG